MPLASEIVDKARSRLRQIYSYLQALNELRNPVITNVAEQQWLISLGDLPKHPLVECGWKKISSDREGEDASDDFLLKVARPSPKPCPAPPAQLEGWVQDGWQRIGGEIKCLPALKSIQNGESVAEKFDQDPNRPRLLKQWQAQRDEWQRTERPAYETQALFERLYALHGQIAREGERLDLVLGDGMLHWYVQSVSIRHPLLLKRVQLHFDPAVPEFTFVETTHAPEFYGAVFRSLSDVNGVAIRKFRDEVDAGLIHPRGEDETSSFLKRLSTTLSPKGTFTDALPTERSPENPQIGRSPVIFMRTRNAGFSLAIEAILEDLKGREDFPSSLLNIAGIEPPISSDDSQACDPLTFANEDEQILFSKPANIEQLQIAQRLQKYGCVLVQGPPGTGKSHTIGNLIGHLLAQGESVLVTSHTTKALRVLREHVVSDLRPLCVSVLESDMDSRRQLETAVGAIAERLTNADGDTLAQQAARLKAERKESLERLKKLRQQLLTVRSDEYRDVVLDGQALSPSQAARKVAAGSGKHDWIPAPIKNCAPLPLSASELIALYRTNSVVAKSDEAELDCPLPNPADLLPPGEFEKLVLERAELKSKDLYVRKELWDGSQPISRTLLKDLLPKIKNAVASFSSDQNWRLNLIEIGKQGGAHREPWNKLITTVNGINDEAGAAQEAIFEHGPALPDSIELEEQIQVLEEVVQYTSQGKRIGWFTLLFRARWKTIIRTATVAGRPPQTNKHFIALNTYANLQRSRKRLVELWQRMMLHISATDWMKLGATPEKECAQFCGGIEECLNWNGVVWNPLLEEIKRIGFRWEILTRDIDPKAAKDPEPLRIKRLVESKLTEIFESRINLLTLTYVQNELTKLQRVIETFVHGERTAHAVRDLWQAVKDCNTERYRSSFERLSALKILRESLELRRSLLTRLETVAPAWASAIRDRVQSHDSELPGDVAEAWQWRQFEQELKRRGSISYDQLQNQIEDLNKSTQRCTTSFIDRLTWAAQVRRTTLPKKQALMGWLLAVKAKGKGTGNKVKVQRLEAEARRLMGECQAAVPVWIMPLSRVVENFNPARDRFDVVIIDEASQADVMALVALYFGKRVVVVGDHQQVSPEAVGQKVEEVIQLIEAHLHDIPNRTLYDGRLSVYDLAQSSFGGLICLREHFRCVPDIIQFSNRLSYDGKILPLRDDSTIALKPHVVAYQIDGATKSGDVNKEEALSVATLITAAIEQPEFQNKTIGVISLVGDDQAMEIDRLLRQHLSPVVFDNHRIVCGNSAQFQGDERDAMFLSVVDVPSDGPLSMRNDERFKKRFNVAASRARDQMWVVHSLDPQMDLKPGDLRREIIEFARNPSSAAEILKDAKQKTDSEFERQVYLWLTNAGFNVVPQFKVGAYRIDFVVKGSSGANLAVECDGDRFHPIEKLPEDMARQAVLERLGWKFARIRGSEFFRSPEQAMKSIFAKLDFHGVTPGSASSPAASTSTSDLVDRIKRRAAEIRHEWDGAEVTYVTPIPIKETPRKVELFFANDIVQPPDIVQPSKKSQLFENATASEPQPQNEDRINKVIAEILPKAFWKCSVCQSSVRLWFGKRGPFIKCDKCKDSLNVPDIFTTQALRRLSASCPECKSPVTASDTGKLTLFRCVERGHRHPVDALKLLG